MQELWSQFEAWLSQYWPEALAYLNPPAADAEILELERALQVKLPDDYIACLKIHNGQDSGNIFDGTQFLSTDEILRQWKTWKSLIDRGAFKDDHSKPENGIKDDWWNPKWIPFTHNGAGDHLCLDLDPSSSGAKGQIITIWHNWNARELKAPSFGVWFESYVKGVLAGRYIYLEEYDGLIDQEYVPPFPTLAGKQDRF